MRTRASFPFRVVHRNKARVVKHLCIFVAPDVDVNVGDNADTHAFVDRTEGPVCEWTRNLLGTHRAHDVTVSAEDVEPAMKMMTAVVGVEAAAHFAHRGDNFVRTFLRIDRP